MSFIGSAKRAWRLTRFGPGWVKVLTVPLVIVLILCWWAVDLCWYAVFGLLVWPWRLVRRGQRRRKIEGLRHREMLEAIRPEDSKGA